MKLIKIFSVPKTGGAAAPLPVGWGVHGGQKSQFGTREADVPFGRKGLLKAFLKNIDNASLCTCP